MDYVACACRAQWVHVAELGWHTCSGIPQFLLLEERARLQLQGLKMFSNIKIFNTTFLCEQHFYIACVLHTVWKHEFDLPFSWMKWVTAMESVFQVGSAIFCSKAGKKKQHIYKTLLIWLSRTQTFTLLLWIYFTIMIASHRMTYIHKGWWTMYCVINYDHSKP